MPGSKLKEMRMAITCPRCGAGYDVALFEFGREVCLWMNRVEPLVPATTMSVLESKLPRLLKRTKRSAIIFCG